MLMPKSGDTDLLAGMETHDSRAFRIDMSRILDVTHFTGKRAGVTKHGKLSVVLVSPTDAVLLEILDRFPNLKAQVEELRD